MVLKYIRSKSQGFCDLLNYDHFADEGIIYNSDGSFQQSFWYYGCDFDGMDDTYVKSFTNYLNLIFASLESGWVVHINSIRVKDQSYINESKCFFNNKVLELIDSERRYFFTCSEPLFKNITALTFTYLPQNKTLAKLSQLFVATNKKKVKKSYYEVTLEYFKNKLEQITRLLNRALNLEAMDSNQTLTYLGLVISGRSIERQLPKNTFVELKHYLTEDFIGGFDLKVGSKYLKVISIDDQFPDDSYPLILERLNQLGFEFRWNTRFHFITNSQAQNNIDFLANVHYQEIHGIKGAVASNFTSGVDIKPNRASIDLFNEAEEARRQGALLGVNHGRYSCTITLYNEIEDVLTEQVKQVENVLNEMSFKTRLESLNALPAYLGGLDGNIYDNFRRFLISTENLSELMPISGEWTGHSNHPSNLFEDNSPPLFYANTRANSLFKGALHWYDVGHTLVIGATGTGKSTLLNFLASSHMRYKNAQLFAFDNKRSLMPLTYAVNGQYYDIGVDETAFQPLANIDEVEGFDFAIEWVAAICELNLLNVDAHKLNAINVILRSLNSLPIEHRTVAAFQLHMSGMDEEIADVFKAYASDDSLKGLVFGANIDYIKFSNWNVFELSEVLSKGDATLIPVLKYLFYKILTKLNGQPTMLIIEEAWVAFSNPVFSKELEKWLKTFRKLNVYVVLVTLNIQDVINSPIKDTLLQQCPTKIFTPNPHIKNPEIAETYKKLLLNDKQISILSNAIIKKEYYLMHQEGNKLFTLDMDDFTFAKAFFCRSSIEDLKMAKKIYNNPTTSFTKDWLTYCGLHDYAEKI